MCAAASGRYTCFAASAMLHLLRPAFPPPRRFSHPASRPYLRQNLSFRAIVTGAKKSRVQPLEINFVWC